MGRVKYHNSWILENYDRFNSWADMCREYNRVFETDIKRVTFKNHCSDDLKLRLKTYGYTNEQDEWLKEHYPVLGAEETSKQFNEIYGLNRSAHAIKEHCHSLGAFLNSDALSRYRERTTNILIDCNHNKAHDVGFVGRPSNGYLQIKTQDGWQNYARFVWEQEKGKVPTGCQMLFLDGDKTNFSISNLACVPTKYMGVLNKKLNIQSDNPELKKVAIEYCELYFLLGGQKGIRQILGDKDLWQMILN